MDNWEYKAVEIAVSLTEKAGSSILGRGPESRVYVSLDTFGAEGWEVIQVIQTAYGPNPNALVAVMKRRASATSSAAPKPDPKPWAVDIPVALNQVAPKAVGGPEPERHQNSAEQRKTEQQRRTTEDRAAARRVGETP